MITAEPGTAVVSGDARRKEAGGYEPLKGKENSMESHLQSIIIIIAAAFVAVCNAPAYIARTIGTSIALLIVARCRRHADALIARRAESATWNQRSSRADRKLLATSLEAAIDETVLTSLLPHCVLDAHRIRAAMGPLRRPSK